MESDLEKLGLENSASDEPVSEEGSLKDDNFLTEREEYLIRGLLEMKHQDPDPQQWKSRLYDCSCSTAYTN